MSSADAKGYMYTDGDYLATYWSDPAPDGRWQAWIESNFTVSRDLQAGGIHAIPRLFINEEAANAAALEHIHGEILWWRRRNDIFYDGTHMGVAYRIFVTRLGLPEEEGWKCVIQYDKPMQNGLGVESGCFTSPEVAMEHGKEIAPRVIKNILNLL